MEIKMNEKRSQVVEVLKNALEPMTLAEISEVIGSEVKTGTTNSMVAAGIIKKVGVKRVPKVVYVEVATYELGEVPSDNK